MHTPTSTTPSSFDTFGLHKSLRSGIRELGFKTPREIQIETIPAGLNGRDVLGLAKTGTGKTAAFALPVLDRILRNPARGPRALVLAPTRELATQIAAEVRALSRFTSLNLVTIYGGVPARNQIHTLRHRRPEIVVGCPGRVLDLYGQGKLDLSHIDMLVLDEADHMFDMGFLPDIRRILQALPSRRQNLLFSATMPAQIRHLADEILHKPHVVKLVDEAPADTIDHALYPVTEGHKKDLLNHLLSQDECTSAIVFTRTKHRARRLADQLAKAGYNAIALQGNMSQNQRDRAMRGFRTRQYDILVATDIAARGIDVRGVTHVINFDVPNTPEAYTHRIGRTGRSEQTGVACTFVTAKDRSWVRDTERMIGARITRETVNGFSADLETDSGRQERSFNRPRRGRAANGRPRAGNGHAGASRKRRAVGELKLVPVTVKQS
jgi:ATP-dependent RNA helicase RhlE